MFGTGPHYSPAPPLLENQLIFLRPPRLRDYDQWSKVRSDSRAFLEPWEPTWSEDALSRNAYRDRTLRIARGWRADMASGFPIQARKGRAPARGKLLTDNLWA